MKLWLAFLLAVALGAPASTPEEVDKVMKDLGPDEQSALSEMLAKQKADSHADLKKFTQEIKEAIASKNAGALEKLTTDDPWLRPLSGAGGSPLGGRSKLAAWVLARAGKGQPVFLGEYLNVGENGYFLGFKAEKGEFAAYLFKAIYGWSWGDVYEGKWEAILANQKSFRAGEEAQLKAEKIFREKIAPLLDKATALVEAKKHAEAIAIWKQLLREHPDADCDPEGEGYACKDMLEANIAASECLSLSQERRSEPTLDKIKDRVELALKGKARKGLEDAISCGALYETGFHFYNEAPAKIVGMPLSEVTKLKKAPTLTSSAFMRTSDPRNRYFGYGPVILIFAENNGRWEWLGFGYFTLDEYKKLHSLGG